MAVIQLYNTLTGHKEDFEPLKSGHVSMYQCGPTVYDTAHVGNLRTFIFEDILRRTLELNGYDVTQIMNITDVDDKTIRRSLAEHIELSTLTQKYEKIFFDDCAALNILKPHQVLRATDHIEDMVRMIMALLDKGIGYASADGIYFSIGMFKDYGALAHINLNSTSVSRIAKDEYEKENPRDFALWKFHTEADGDISWNAPFGKGRPGWSIECSAMAIHALGAQIDIHAGGTDLIFPHHTNEIAQSEAVTGKQFVKYWVHGAFMNVYDAKMAKSAKNFVTLGELKENLISPLAFRYWLLTAHYRTQVNFTFEAVKAAQTALIRLIEHVIAYNIEATDPSVTAIEAHPEYIERFHTHINDDLDTANALALTWELIKDKTVTPEVKYATLIQFDEVFGLGLASVKIPAAQSSVIPPEIQALADAREIARVAKDWAQADALRSEIESRGYTIIDTGAGIKIVAK